MTKKKRYFRCPDCAFEHPTLGEAELRDDHEAVIPWSCPICRASGILPYDGAVSRDYPDPEHPPATTGEHSVACPSYSWTCLEDDAEIPLP